MCAMLPGRPAPGGYQTDLHHSAGPLFVGMRCSACAAQHTATVGVAPYCICSHGASPPNLQAELRATAYEQGGLYDELKRLWNEAFETYGKREIN